MSVPVDPRDFRTHRISRAKAWLAVLDNIARGQRWQKTFEWVLLTEQLGRPTAQLMLAEAQKSALAQAADNGVDPQHALYMAAWALSKVNPHA